MVTAWQKAAEFDPGRAAAKTWITTIARRRAIDLLRSGQRRDKMMRNDAYSIGEVFDQNDLRLPRSPESSVTSLRLSNCFAELNRDAASCIRFAYLDGLTFREIAERANRSLGTVKSWVRRGLAKLQACMQR